VTAGRCIGEPVSWLALERLRLGELPPDQRGAVEQHLVACAACAACLAEIDRPLVLGPLPAPTTTAALWSRWRAAWHRAGRARIWAPTAVALVLLALLVARPKPVDDTVEPWLAGIKGGDVSLSLVRARDGAINHAATTFAAGDRWMALVTCPSARVVFWDVAVFDGARASLPLAPAAPITCGNRVPLPGAFRLDGERPLEVCLLLSGDPIDRTRVSALTTRAAACVTLQPER
jgi:hypothetical protein